jgi:hypothetical protein
MAINASSIWKSPGTEWHCYFGCMVFQSIICRVASVVALAIVLAFSHASADSLKVVENFFGNNVVSPSTLPEKQKMRLIGSVTPKVVGAIARITVYDDAATKRIGDYAEIYNSTDDLIAIIWFDGFGIVRSAIDRAIVLNKGVEGVLVLVLDGELV